MANIQITQLPAGGAITGTEQVPVVQNGVTVRVSTAAIAASPAQQQTFLTLNQEPTLPNSRALSGSTGIGLTDGGALSTLQITLNGASGSLEAAANGLVAKTGASTVTSRSIAVSGSGLSITNGSGASGDPTLALSGLPASLAGLSGTGLLNITNSTSVGSVVILGTSDQISVANGNAVGNPTISIASNPVLPGIQGVVLPQGLTADRPPVPTNGELRYNTELENFEGYANGVWGSIAVGGGVTSIDTGTGLTGGPITSTGTISIANTAVTAGSYGSSSQVSAFTVNAQGQITSAQNIAITPASIGAISAVNGTANEITASPSGTTVTMSLPSALTFTGKTVTGGTYVSPAITDTIKFTGTGAGSYTPFVQTFASYVTNLNNYQLNYIQNTNNGSDASIDYVAYNDSSDVNSYFVDVGISSSNYTNATYEIFPPNGAYVYTGGGNSGQAAALLLGTSNSASDIVMFTGGTLLANTRATIKGNTGNFLIGTTTDTGYKLNVNGTTYFGGASTFGSTVELNANPTTALQAATKQYVDQQVTAGIHIHEPVRVETTGNLTATYVQGGTTFDITTITSGTTVTTSVNHGLAVNDQIWLYTSAGNGLSTNTAYFVYSIPALNQLTLSLAFDGAQITGLTNASGLTYATRANSGVGATLTNAGAQVALELDGITLSVADRVMVRLQTNGAQNGVYVVTAVGSIITNWVLTRSSDANVVSPSDPNGLGTGDYFFTREGILNAGDSHVLTTAPNTMIIGYTTLTYTQFSGSVDYIGGTNITVLGQTISVSGTIAATLGGTGTSTVTTGDLLYGSGTNTWSKLPLGTAYKSLTVNAGATQLEWNAVALNQSTAVSGQLGVSNGGTGLSSYATGDTLYATGSTTLAKLTLGTSGYVLTAGASAPQYVAQSTLSVGSATTATNIAGGIASQIPYQTSAGATSFIANGTAGQVLTSAGTSTPTWSGISGGTF